MKPMLSPKIDLVFKMLFVRDADVLEAIQMKAVAAESLEEFERYLSSL